MSAPDVALPRDGEWVWPGPVEVSGHCPLDPPWERIELTWLGQTVAVQPLCGPGPADLGRTGGVSGWRHLVDLAGCEPGQAVQLRVERVGPGGREPVGTSVVRVLRPADTPDPDDAAPLAELAREADAAAGRWGSAADLDGSVRLLVMAHDLRMPGGAQLALRDVLTGVAGDDRCAPALVLAQRQNDGPLRAELEALGHEVRLVDPLPHTGAAWEQRVAEVCDLAAAAGCTHVLADTLGTALVADAGARAGVPVVWSCHEPWGIGDYWTRAFGTHAVTPHVQARSRWAMGAVGTTTAPSQASLDAQAPWRGGRPAHVVHPGGRVPAPDAADRGRALREQWHVPAGDLLVVLLGRMSPDKGQALAVEAWARCARPGEHLALVGFDVSMWSGRLRRQAGGTVLKVPVTSEPSAWFAAADLALLLSDQEASGTVVTEMRRCATALLAADLPGPRELAGPGATFVDRRDVGAIARALRSLLDEGRAGLRARGEADRAGVPPSGDAYAATLVGLICSGGR